MRTLKQLWIPLLLLVSATLTAQTGLDSSVASTLTLGDLDFSAATIRQAGAASFYVRNVSLDGDAYSLLLEESASGIWSVSEVVSETSNVIPSDAVLDFATISAVDGNTIRIDGVLVGSQIYGGSLSVGENADLTLVGDIQTAELSVSQARADALAVLAGTTTDDEFDEALSEQRALLETEIAKVEDLGEIMKRGAMVTPALCVDGEIKAAGKVLKADVLSLLLAGRHCAADVADRTRGTPRRGRSADRRAEFHHRLVGVPRSAGRQQLARRLSSGR